MSALSKLNITKEQIASFCKQHHIKRLAFFGSVVREDFTSDSDVDILYEFEKGHHPGWEITEVSEKLSRLLNREIDFIPFGPIRNPFRRRAITRDQEIAYA